MITELEKTLLKSGVDLMIDNLSSVLLKIENEQDRTQQRQLINSLVILSSKIDKFELEKTK